MDVPPLVPVAGAVIDLGKSMGDILEDPVSFDYMVDAVITKCGHSFSLETIQEVFEGDRMCPLCRKLLDPDTDVQPNYKMREVYEFYMKDKEAREKRAQELENEEAERQQREEERRNQEANERRAEIDNERARARAERELLERQSREELERKDTQLADLDRRYNDELDALRKKHEADALERQKLDALRVDAEKAKGEIDKHKRELQVAHKRAEDYKYRYKQLQEKYQVAEKQMIDIKSRYKRMEQEMSKWKDKCRMLEAEEAKRKEAEAAAQAGTGLLNYIPSISLPWWSSTPVQLGPLVRKFSDYRIQERCGLKLSSVWRAETTGKDVAVKRIEFKGDQNVFREAMMHYNLCSTQSHGNLLPLQGIMQGKDSTEYYLVLPYVQQDFEFAISSNRAQYSITQIRHFMFQILLTVSYLHSANVVHRNIQPTSLMISNDGKARLWLTSFKSARSLASVPLDPVSRASLWYSAPEIILSDGRHQQKLQSSDWKAADIWSCGCILGQLLNANNLIFGGKNTDEVLSSILSFEECRESLGEMLYRFSVLTTHPGIQSKINTLDNILLCQKEFGGDGGIAVNKSIELRRRASTGTNLNESGARLQRVKPLHRDEDVEEQPRDLKSSKKDRKRQEMPDEYYALKDLFTRLLKFDPDERISAEQALAHPFFQDMPKLPKYARAPETLASALEDEAITRFLRDPCAGLIN